MDECMYWIDWLTDEKKKEWFKLLNQFMCGMYGYNLKITVFNLVSLRANVLQLVDASLCWNQIKWLTQALLEQGWIQKLEDSSSGGVDLRAPDLHKKKEWHLLSKQQI